MPLVGRHLTAEYFDDQAILICVDESTLLRIDAAEKLKLNEQDSIFFNSTLTSPKKTIEMPTKPYVDSLHENSKNGLDLSSVFNDQANNFDNNNLTNI